MSDFLEDIIKEEKKNMEAAIKHFQSELLKIRTGKATPAMLDGIMVDYYGTPTPLQQVANVTTQDAKSLLISPWEKKTLADIEQAIFAANLGLTPMNDGETVRIIIPPLTQERRLQLVKQSKALAEDSKISVRNARRDMLDAIKSEVKAGYPEDAGKREEENSEKIYKSFIKKIEDIIEAKEKDLMSI